MASKWSKSEAGKKYHREYQRKLRATKKGREANNTLAKKYYHKNKEKIKKKMKIYRDTSPKYPEINRRNVISYYHKNKKRVTERILKWRKLNSNNPEFLVRRILRARLTTVMRKIKQKRIADTKSLLGCEFSFFISHIEKKFKKGMTWQNYPKWHIDHIKPVSRFDLTKSNNQKKCFHYSNLQPLWAKENLKKYNK